MVKPFSSKIAARRIIQERVRKALIKTLKAKIDALTGNDPETDYLSFVFVDLRDNGSLLLTPEGYSLLENDYGHWTIQLENPVLTIWQHAYVSAVSQFPYYIDKEAMTLTTFDSALGVAMKLVGSSDFADIERVCPIN